MKQIYRIDELVCEEFNITVNQLRSKSRKGLLPTARFICWLIIRKKKVLNGLWDIAYEYDIKQHASIIHGINSVKGRMMWEKDLERKYINVLLKLG